MNIYQKFLFLLGFESNADNTRFEKHNIAVKFVNDCYIIETDNFVAEPVIIDCEDYDYYDSRCEYTAFTVFVGDILYYVASAYGLEDDYCSCIRCSCNYYEENAPLIAIMLHELGYRPEEIAVEMYGNQAFVDLSTYEEVAYVSEEKPYERELVGETYWNIYKNRTYIDNYFRINKTNERIDVSSHEWIINMIETLKK